MIKKINGQNIITPSECTWGLQDLSSEDSGRTLDGLMHKDIVAQKRTIECSWNGLNKADAATLLQQVNASVFMSLTYDDPMSGTEQTRTFYVGDRSAPVHIWNTSKKIFSTISFSFIER